MQETELINAIFDDPTNLAIRMIYADMLEETGKIKEANMLRQWSKFSLPFWDIDRKEYIEKKPKKPSDLELINAANFFYYPSKHPCSPYRLHYTGNIYYLTNLLVIRTAMIIYPIYWEHVGFNNRYRFARRATTYTPQKCKTIAERALTLYELKYLGAYKTTRADITLTNLLRTVHRTALYTSDDSKFRKPIINYINSIINHRSTALVNNVQDAITYYLAGIVEPVPIMPTYLWRIRNAAKINLIPYTILKKATNFEWKL